LAGASSTVDVDDAGRRRVDIGHDVDHREVVGAVERLLQFEQLALGEIVAALEWHVAIEETLAELRVLEHDPAETVALAGIPRQVHDGAVLGAVDLDAVRDQPRVEEAGGGERTADGVPGAVVLAVVQCLVRERVHPAQGIAHGGHLCRGIVDLHVHGCDLHRRAGHDVQGHMPVVAHLGQVAGGRGFVIAIGAQGGLHLIGCFFVEAANLRGGDVARGVLAQFHARDDRALEGVVDAVHGQHDAGVGHGREDEPRKQQSMASGEAHERPSVQDPRPRV
jgi:hypothetical protein